jgi:hypothetical protein
LRIDISFACASAQRNNRADKALSDMTDPLEDILAPVVVERALSIFESFKDRQHVDLVQARKALTQYVFQLIGAGQTDEKSLTVSDHTYLKRLERDREASKP